MRSRHSSLAPAFLALLALFALLAAGASPGAATGQTFPVDDPVLRRIWTEGMERSELRALAQVLMDSVGPRLTGTHGLDAAERWASERYRAWGIEAAREVYGTWPEWRRGVTHVDLLAPRVRTLEATLSAWSPGTPGAVEGAVMALPPLTSPEDVRELLSRAVGQFVLLSFAEPTCRPDESWREHSSVASFRAMAADRTEAREAWAAPLRRLGLSLPDLALLLDQAGAAGILTSEWPGAWGVSRIVSGWTRSVPTLNVSCEDYGLLHRLAVNGQGPRLRVRADAELLAERPVSNLIAVLPGRERPDEYVLLSAHLDSWDGASGATDNGTGTVVMMEAMRLLRVAYPTPKRTLLAGHWNGEEQGLLGSTAYAARHPEVVEGLQALFNQDAGTGRVDRVSVLGLLDAGVGLARWWAHLPAALTAGVVLELPGVPGSGSDYASFNCYGAPAFALGSRSWGYSEYTWHANRDAFDKIAMDDLRRNAVLVAMLAYLAAEDDRSVERTRRVLPLGPAGDRPLEWPTCQDGRAQR